MNRRAFMQWLGGTAAGAAAAHVLDVDKLLWIPGEKTIFIPAAPKICERCGVVHSIESPEAIMKRYVDEAVKKMADEWDRRAYEYVMANAYAR